jgi:hypothetical protein
MKSERQYSFWFQSLTPNETAKAFKRYVTVLQQADLVLSSPRVLTRPVPRMTKQNYYKGHQMFLLLNRIDIDDDPLS